MQIAHAEARRLIHLEADHILSVAEKTILSAHLQGCSECRLYAEDIGEVENVLVPVLKRQWDRHPVPLSIDALIAKRNPNPQTSIILTIRSAMISVIFLAFVLTAWQFALSGGRVLRPAPVEILAVPTPSTTKTKVVMQNCELTRYLVQPSDTLDSIAAQFAISREDLITLNGLRTDNLQAAMELTIPICYSTPTGTANPVALTSTDTPIISPVFSTPGGS